MPRRRIAFKAYGLRTPVRLRSPHTLLAGCVLIAIAAITLVLVSGLNAGQLRSIGPGMMPRWLAFGLAICGIGLVITSFLSDEEEVGAIPFRGSIFIIGAIFAFASTIRPFGLAVSGPLALVVAGYATPEARLRELIVLALALTAFCIVLFGDFLNLPIPIFPSQLLDYLPEGWSLKFAMRVHSGLLIAFAVAVALLPLHREADPLLRAVPQKRKD